LGAGAVTDGLQAERAQGFPNTVLFEKKEVFREPHNTEIANFESFFLSHYMTITDWRAA